MATNGRVSVAVGYRVPCVGSGVSRPHPVTAKSETHAGAPSCPKTANRWGTVLNHGSNALKEDRRPPGEEICDDNMFGDTRGDALGRTRGGDALEMLGETSCQGDT